MTGNQLRSARNTPIMKTSNIYGYLPLNRRNRRIQKVSNDIYNISRNLHMQRMGRKVRSWIDPEVLI